MLCLPGLDYLLWISMANIIAIPANHADQMFLNHKFFKQYDRLMEYIHTVLIIKQPEIFYSNGAQIELTWRHVDTQHMCYGTINIHNTIGLPKMVTYCKKIFDTIVAESCVSGTHPYAHMFI